jgi:hypothetical protein
MNKVEKLEKQYEGYKAACQAINATKPKELIVRFCKDSSEIRLQPGDDHVRAHIDGYGWINIPLNIIPEMTKALEWLLEDEDAAEKA